ncbi:hypothetical protein C8Q70DRAFT_1064408 [Cubamyces menziesii]|nr:hypothetical protein C8Q70DRAFT_1064408 [Cubamyces menziesii]
MSTTPNPLFKFNRDGYSVHVNNIADAVSRREILDLFNNLIGDITKCDEMHEGNRRYYVLTFATQDSAKKALCMSGYNVDGIPLCVLAVTAVPPSEVSRIGKAAKQSDARRNLYVLGLPFDLTKTEFAEIFARFGAVAHAVILATVDNASRRRGFIVMSSHHEAKAAMEGLNRKEIKGHIIDVSWAVVQRSEGFLDGGDRATVLSTTSPSPSPAPFEMKPASPVIAPMQMPVIVTPPSEYPPACDFAIPSCCLSIKNLPTVLFSQLSDLHPLLGPYGDIKKLELLRSTGDRTHVSAIVEYASISQAVEAMQALNGQVYSNIPLVADFMPPGSGILGDTGKPGLNPRAAPFVAQPGSAHNALLTSVTPVYPGSGFSEAGLSALAKGGLLALDPRSLSAYGTPLLYVPFAGVRPNSAPTSSVPYPLYIGITTH